MSLKKIAAACRIVLPHVGLVTFLAVYVVFGAGVFYALERPREEEVRRAANEKHRAMRRALLVRIHRLTDLHGIEKEHFNTLADPLVDNYIKEMMHSFAQPYEYPNTLSAVHDTWTFSAAISFTAIMLVTIGYGTPAPVTMSGRIFCVLYGMFGIPLTLMTVADVAKFLANIFLKQFIRISTLKKRCRDRPGTASLSVPLKSATCIFLLYPPLAAAFLSWWEQWSYGDSLYFCFISVLTIGFGDMKPSNDKFFIVTILFVVMGLVITTMCLDLVAGFYIDKVHFFGRHYSLAKMLAQMIMDNAAGRLKGRKFLHATIGLNLPIVPDTYDKYHDKESADSTDNEEEHCLLSDWKAMKYFDSFSSLDIMTADEYY